MNDDNHKRRSGAPGPAGWQPISLPTGETARGQARHAEGSGPATGPDRTPPDPTGEPDTADEFVVRPFLLTGGRTRPARDDLRVESLIQAQGEAPPGLRFEARQIYDLCREPNSVAEVAAALRVPLGVARVLVSDLMAEGHVALVQNQALSVQLLERIRDRVRAL